MLSNRARAAIIVALREKRLSLRKIAARVGCSHTTVANVLRRAGMGGPLPPVQVNPAHLALPDRAVAEMYRTSQRNVRRQRRRRRRVAANQARRHRLLCRSLFGASAKPGAEFVMFILPAAKKLPPAQRRAILAYLRGGRDRNGYDRVLRHRAVRSLKKQFAQALVTLAWLKDERVIST